MANEIPGIEGKVSLSQDDRKTIEAELRQQFQDSYTASSGLRSNIVTWRDLYSGNLPPKAFKWSSNIHLPFMKSLINTAATKIAQAAIGTDPIFEVEAESPDFQKFEKEEENFLQYWNERIRFKNKVAMAIKEAEIAGQCWLKNGVSRTGKELKSGSSTINVSDLDVEPTCDYIITEDMMLIPNNAPSFKRARGAFARKNLWWDEIEQGFDAGLIYEDAKERIEAKWINPSDVSQVHEQQGITATEPYNKENSEYECWEGIYRWKKPGTKRETEWYMLVYHDLEENGDMIILRCQEYKPLYGKNWFYVPIICNPMPNSMWGSPLAADLAGMQKWLNATFQQTTDTITMVMMPPIAVNASSQMAQRNLKYGPAEKWMVSNPSTDVNVMGGNASALAGVSAIFAQEGTIRAYGERISNTSDVSTGRQSQERKTAFEISAVINQGDQAFEAKVGTIQFGMEDGEGLVAYAENLLFIIRNFLPDRKINYKPVGKGLPDWKTADSKWHKGDYKFIPRGNSANSNPELRARRAAAMREMSMQNPFLAFSPLDTPDTVLSKVRSLYKIYRDSVSSLGEQHPEMIMPPEPTNYMEAMSVALAINPQVVSQIMAVYPPPNKGGEEGTENPQMANANVEGLVQANPGTGAGIQPGQEAVAGIGAFGAGNGGQPVQGTPPPSGMA